MKSILDKIDIYKSALRAHRCNLLPEFLLYLEQEDIKALKYYLINVDIKENKEMLKIVYAYEINKNSKKSFIRSYK